MLKGNSMGLACWRAILLSTLIPLVNLSHPAAHAQQEPGAPIFRLLVRRVPVDVVVLDKNGNPVQGLKKADFLVKEDGNPQQILSFDTYDGSRPDFIPPATPSLPANTFLNLPQAPERGPLYILYYDMVNTPPADQELFRRELLKFIDHAQAGTRIALFVNAQGLHLLQGFTSDHSLIREAALKKGPGPHIPSVFLYGENYGRADVGGCLSNLTFISEYMSGIPGRKNLIWLSSIFPIPVSPTLTNSSTAFAGGGPPSFSVGAGGGPQVLDLTELERENIEHTYAAMMRSQIALYPVDARGVTGAATENSHEAANAMIDHQNMDVIASATGGRAFYGSNTESTLIDRAIQHGESYYTLSYAPTNMKYDDSERRIQVTLTRKGDYRLTYRRVYYAVSDDNLKDQHKKDELQARFLAAKAQDTLWANIEHGAPILHDLVFTAHLATEGSPHMATPEQMQSLEDTPDYFLTRRRKAAPKPPAPVKLQKYVIRYGVIDPQLKANAARHDNPAALEFAAAAYNADGRLLNSMLNQGVPSGVKGKSDALFHAIQELEVPPGAAYIRMAVRDTATNRTGTLEVTLPLQSSPPQQAAR
ncbi:MAG TPA: VWA domain-containing protein [Terracidiphilus sp.]|jgi:VWFA-related protein